MLCDVVGLLIGVQRGRGSDLDLTAVNEELDAVDEARLIRRQEQHRFGDLFGLADAARGDAACEIALGALRLLPAAEQHVEAGRFRHARADRVDADMPAFEVEYPVAREASHGRLCR